MQQAKTYAEMLDIRFAYISNGDAFAEYDFKTGSERELPLAHKTSKTASSSAPGSLLDVIGGTSYKKIKLLRTGFVFYVEEILIHQIYLYMMMMYFFL